jgi:hypothetical protein
LADAVQTKGLGSALWCSKYCWMAGNQLCHALEHPAADAVLGDQAEEALDLVDLGGGGRGEVHVEPLVPLQSHLHLGVLVGGIVVGDQVHVEVLRRLGIDPTQELQPLLMPVSRHALADYLAGGHVESAKQSDGGVALLVMGHGAAAAFPERQATLSAIERLDLALFIHRKSASSLF